MTLKLLNSINVDEMSRLNDRVGSELNTIVGLILQCCKPNIIFLYGPYAGDRLMIDQKGYHLLLVFSVKPPELHCEEIMRMIDKELDPSRRIEPDLYIECITLDFINTYISRSFHLFVICVSGLVIYNDKTISLPIIGTPKVSHFYLLAESNLSRDIELGKVWLDHAENDLKTPFWSDIYSYSASVHMARAMDACLNAACWAFYGYFPYAHHLAPLYSCISHCSKKLHTAMADKESMYNLLKNLQKDPWQGDEFAKVPSRKTLLKFIRQIKKMMAVIESECWAQIMFYRMLEGAGQEKGGYILGERRLI